MLRSANTTISTGPSLQSISAKQRNARRPSCKEMPEGLQSIASAVTGVASLLLMAFKRKSRALSAESDANPYKPAAVINAAPVTTMKTLVRVIGIISKMPPILTQIWLKLGGDGRVDHLGAAMQIYPQPPAAALPSLDVAYPTREHI
ncbi:hypothetical protein ABIE69_002347 [Rhodobacteraceae bacterium MBR-64]